MDKCSKWVERIGHVFSNVSCDEAQVCDSQSGEAYSSVTKDDGPQKQQFVRGDTRVSAVLTG